MSVTGAIVAGVGAAASIGSAAIGANAAGSAASTQAGAANYAANLQKQAADESLAFQQQQYNTNQKNFAPWLQAGTGAIGNLQYLLGIPGNYNTSGNPQDIGFTPRPDTTGDTSSFAPHANFPMPSPLARPGNRTMMSADGSPEVMTADANGGYQPATSNTAQLGPQGTQINPALGNFGSLLTPWTEQFKAPDNITEQNDPGYQARLKLGTDAMERSAAARGGVLTGGTAKDLNSFASDYASNEYGNVYSRAWNDYANRYNTFQTNNTNTFNRLSSLAGVGQQTASTLGMMGQNAANNVSNTLLSSAGQIGQQANNAGAAMASGYVGSANAINQGLGGVNSALQNYLFLKQMGSGSGAGISPSMIQAMAGPAPAPSFADFGAGTIG